jgi:GMP synthase-like glutamine amidotransferase
MSKILIIQNDETDPPHLVGLWLTELGFTLQIVKAYQGEEIPPTVPQDIVAVIPLGGHMNANDDTNYPFLRNERALLKSAVAAGIPVLGICLGSQLLAVATGGRVEKAKTGEVGIYEIVSTNSSDHIFDFSQPLPVAQWHEDEVTELPDGATLLASSELCNNQIYRMNELTYGLQFHPEIDLSIVKRWEADADNAFIDSGKRTIQPEMVRMEAVLSATWKPFIQHWGDLVRKAATSYY